MKREDMEEQIIESYKQDEKMMILVFAQWCVNHDLDAFDLYTKTYPDQKDNPLLQEALSLTVPKEESETIADDTLFGVLSLYGNDDLAHTVSRHTKK
ncbi:hypothetical protein [Salibacterium halotolerans]|uniref:Uncharacterized protein n=1 Tax=Salibacterium halotolerans TaxID=1884432 RepID=A0A1I5QG93_9BACI|nr:hypothetical protein [Salibacterium halotolerans]SFP45268.1 hypothetical protein SAMN05518683_105148 [Salibacterium halotolerans]